MDDTAYPSLSFAGTAQHGAMLSRKIATCMAAFDSTIEQWTTAIGRAYRTGEIDEEGLLAALNELRFAAKLCGRPWVRAWDANVPVAYSGLSQRMLDLYRPNGGEGVWRGEMPFVYPQRRPRTGQAVVYVLYDMDHEVIYVGSSGKCSARLKAHSKQKLEARFWMCWACTDRKEAYRREAVLIREHKPKLNKVGKK